MNSYSDVPSRTCQDRRLRRRVPAWPAALVLFFTLGPAPALGGKEASVALSTSVNIQQQTVDELYLRWQEVLEGKARAVLLDVREQWEFEAGHIEGSSHLALSNLAAAPQLLPDRNAEIWVFCRTQRRATLAADQLRAMGFANLRLVNGGMLDWSGRGHPLWTPASPQGERNCAHYLRQGLLPGKGCSG